MEYVNVPCPQCSGEGKVVGDLAPDQRQREIPCVFCRIVDPRSGLAISTGELPNGRTCHKCHGGKRLIVMLRVHPATIKGTRYLGPDAETDPLSMQIEQTIEEWRKRNATYWMARVVMAEYCHNGTQEIKALRMGVSRAWFRKNLDDAHTRIEVVIAGC